MTIRAIVFSIFLLFIFSCEQKPYKDKPNHLDWKSLDLPNNWTIEVPKNFKDSTAQGIDSAPGYIYSTTDSISLDFDSGRELFHKQDCEFSKQVDDAKKSPYAELFNERTGFNHKILVDTIGNRIASIILPTESGKGNIHLSIDDCLTGAWLGISERNLTEAQQKIVLEIFKTIRMKGDNK
jgi:hypothetical protein